MDNNVFLLWHVYEESGADDDENLLGVYSTEENAKKNIEKWKSVEKFHKHPDGFMVCKYILDEDEWKEGFVFEP
jgi:homoserine kinase type II